MADDVENDDQWLYGENTDFEPESVAQPEDNTFQELPVDFEQNQDAELSVPNDTSVTDNDNDLPLEEQVNTDESVANDIQNESTTETNEPVEKQNGEGSDNDKEDYDEDSDDDVNVVIGDFKATPASYSSLNIKRGGLLTSTTKGDKPQAQSGKFAVEEFEQAGLVNGIPVSDFNLDSLEDKPWRKPGADITDYFNYGFNEDTWRAYCERQKRMRVNESGTGLLPLNTTGMPRPSTISIMNDNRGHPAATPGAGIPIKVIQSKENVIQVMTADRREYSRKPPVFPDMSVPPPAFEEFVPELNFDPEPEPFYGSYEPTQDIQWGTEANPTWQPHEIKTLTSSSPGPTLIPPMSLPSPVPPIMPPILPPTRSPGGERSPSLHRSRSRDRESSRREIERPRDRERSHRRERSRSRSRRHKSRSRSPSRSHRSHRKKKSKRHEGSD